MLGVEVQESNESECKGVLDQADCIPGVCTEEADVKRS